MVENTEDFAEGWPRPLLVLTVQAEARINMLADCESVILTLPRSFQGAPGPRVKRLPRKSRKAVEIELQKHITDIQVQKKSW